MFGPKLGMIVSNVYVIACVVAAMPHAARSAISCSYSGFELVVIMYKGTYTAYVYIQAEFDILNKCVGFL